MVARRRRIFGQRRVGHAGTLDPDATGVLLVGLGRATRPMRFLTALPKTYTTDIVLGTATSTLDASGEVSRPPTTCPHVTPAARGRRGGRAHGRHRAGAADGVGRQGRRAPAARARREGIEVERAPRRVTVSTLRHGARPGAAGRLPGRGGVLLGDLHPGVGGRPGAGPGGGADVDQPAPHPHRLVRPDDMHPLDAIGPESVLTPAQAMRDLDAVDGGRSGRCSHPHGAAPRPGPARRGRRRSLGHARRGGGAARCLRGDRQRPHPAGRGPGRTGRRDRPARPVSDRRRTTLNRDAAAAARRSGDRCHHRGLRRGPPRPPRPPARPVGQGGGRRPVHRGGHLRPPPRRGGASRVGAPSS